MRTKQILAFCAVAALVIMPMFAFAQIDPKANPIGYLNDQGQSGGTQITDIGSIIINLVNWFAWFITVAAVVMGLYSGFLFVTARGETAQLSTARKTLLYAIIGIAVAVFSFSIITITKVFFLL